MTILVDRDTRLAVAGITGRQGSFHTLNNRSYGTNVVGGVTPGKGGQDVAGIPVFGDWATAVDEVKPNTVMIFVPPPFAAESILEVAAAGIELVIAITEGIPAHDELLLYNTLRRDHPRTRLIGPNCPGVLSPGRANVGIIPAAFFREGNVGRGLALGHPDLPDRQRARAGGSGEQLDRRHRGRPGAGLLVRRHPGALPGG